MASQGPLSPATVVTTDIGQVADWINPTNAASSNNSYARAFVELGSDSNALDASNFGFSIPTGATIDGIVVEIERSMDPGDSGRIQDKTVKILGNPGTAVQHASSEEEWPTSDAYHTYGNATDEWITEGTWTPAQINAAGFGVRLEAQELSGALSTARVDHVRVTVHYTPAPAGAGNPAAFSGVGTCTSAALPAW